MNTFKKISVKTLLFLFFYIFVLIIILVFTIGSSMVIDKVLIAKTDAEMQIKLNSYSNSLESILDENVELSFNLCNDENLKYYFRIFPHLDIMEQLQTEQKITQIFESYWRSRTEISQMKFFAYNKKYTATGYNAILQLEILEQDPVFSPYLSLESALIADYSLQPLVTEQGTFVPDPGKAVLMTKVSDYDDSLLGYLFVELSKESLYNNLISKNTSSNIYVIDNNGKYVLAPDSRMYGTTVENADILEKNKANHFSKTATTVNDISAVAFLSATNNFGYKVLEVKNTSALLYWRKYLIFITVFSALAISGLFWLFAAKMLRFLTAPIIRLSEAMRHFDTVDTQNVFGRETLVLCQQYNYLLEKQAQLMEEIKQKSNNEKQAEIKALIAQINPHFLFNTLNSIGWKAMDANMPQFVSSISKLGKICHIIYNLDSMVTTLAQELEHVCLYIDLQNECFQNNLTYSIHMDDALKSQTIPKFILQPIVENAILHGFYQINHTGIITIRVTRTDVLQITIADNGVGIPEDILKKLNACEYKSEKYGIRNVNDRIKLICGDHASYGIHYKSNGHSYTIAQVTLPLDLPSSNL